MKHLKKILSLLLVAALTLGAFITLPADVYADDDYWDTHKKCFRCGDITDDFCDNCSTEHYAVCSSCHSLLHCAFCDGCYLTMDVEPCEENCFQAYCIDCALSEGYHCNECGKCYTGDEDQLCGNCFRCPDCVIICSDCGWCYECQSHCPECYSCDYEGNECSEGGEHCRECCYLCDQCGECIIGKGSDVCGYCLLCEECCEANACESCGMCVEDSEFDEHICEVCGLCMNGDAVRCEICGLCDDCCLEEAAALGCECGEYCWTEVEDAHICADCGECFGVVDPCQTCEAAGEYRCVDCCEDLSVSFGCDCPFPVCTNDPDWEDHLEKEHVGADNTHNAVPQAAWSMDSVNHYKSCRLCGEEIHVTARAKHSFDERGKCTVCGYVSGQGIFITRQPVSKTVDVSDDRNTGVFTTAAFNVSAAAKNPLSYQWQYSPKKDFSSDVRSFTDVAGSTGSKTNGLVYAVAANDCAVRFGAQHNEMYIRCKITDGKTTVYSGVVTLTVRHVFDDTENMKITAAGHAYKCRGVGCAEYEALKPHQYSKWTWNADHTERTSSCEICGYKNVYLTHNHTINWDDPAFDDGWTCTDEWYHEYEITVNGKTYTQDLLRHTGVCTVEGCTQVVSEGHTWGPMTPRNPGKAPTTASQRYQVHRVCTVCGYDDTKMKYDYQPGDPGVPGSYALFWQFGVHPVTVVDGTMDNLFGMVRDGKPIVLTANREANKTFIGWKIEYQKLEGGVYVTKTVTVKTSNLDTIRNSSEYQGWFPADGRFSFAAADFVMPAWGDAGMWTFTAQYANACKHPSKVVENAKAATCTQMGYTGDKVCLYCGILFTQGQETDELGHGALKTVQKDVPALDRYGEVRTDRHGDTIYSARAASAGDCTTRGYTGDKICTVCGEVAERGVSTGFNHSWEEIRVIKKGTNTEKGVSEFECAACGVIRTMPTDYSGPDYRLVPSRSKVFFSFNFGDKVTPVEITVTPKGRNADEIKRVVRFEPAGELNYIVDRTGDWSFTVAPDMTLASENEFDFPNIISAYVELKNGRNEWIDLVDVNMNPVKSKEKYKIIVINGTSDLWSTATGRGVRTPVSEARSGEMICILHDKETFTRWEVVSDPSGLVKETLEKHGRLADYDTSFLMPPNDVVIRAVFDHDHEWDAGKVTTPATYTAKGVKTFTCSVCGLTRTEEIPKLSAPAINSETAKESGGVVLAVPERSAGDLLVQAGSGASLFTADGKPADPKAPLATDMTLVKSDGKKLTVVVLGDVNADGAVSTADARLSLRKAVGLESYKEGTTKFIACNVNGDASVTTADARLILRAAVNLEKLKLS